MKLRLRDAMDWAMDRGKFHREFNNKWLINLKNEAHFFRGGRSLCGKYALVPGFTAWNGSLKSMVCDHCDRERQKEFSEEVGPGDGLVIGVTLK